MLTVEREDGTLLRAKAIPNGMIGYLIGKVVMVSGMVLISVITCADRRAVPVRAGSRWAARPPG